MGASSSCSAVICIHDRDAQPFRHDRVWIVPQQHVVDCIRAQRNRQVPFERLARFADTVGGGPPLS
jgi:hypothetical protein